MQELSKMIIVLIVLVVTTTVIADLLSSFLESLLLKPLSHLERCWWVDNVNNSPIRCSLRQISGGFCIKHNSLMDSLEEESEEWWLDED